MFHNFEQMRFKISRRNGFTIQYEKLNTEIDRLFYISETPDLFWFLGATPFGQERYKSYSQCRGRLAKEVEFLDVG